MFNMFYFYWMYDEYWNKCMIKSIPIKSDRQNSPLASVHKKWTLPYMGGVDG